MRKLQLTAAAVIAAALSGCAVYSDGYGYGGHRDYERGSDAPNGHLPPPGECRIWYTDRPPGHQPPPGDCHKLRYQVPPGARLIHG